MKIKIRYIKNTRKKEGANRFCVSDDIVKESSQPKSLSS